MEALTGYNLEAEQAYLGVLFLEPELVKEIAVEPKQMSPGRNSNLLATMIDMDKKEMPIDPMSIMDRIGGHNLDRVGGVAYFTELATGFFSPSQFETYGQRILEAHKRREVAKIGEELREGLDLDEAVKRLSQIQDTGIGNDNGDIKEALIAMYDDIESADGEIRGIRTGYTELDKMTGGYKGGNLVIVAARPSVGKTAFAINTGLNAVASADNPDGDLVAIFSLEMGKKELLKRAAATITNLDMQKMKRARIEFDGNDWRKLTTAMAVLGNCDLKIFDEGRELKYIYSKVRKLRQQNPNRRIHIIVDYLQLIVGSPEFKGNRQGEIGDISMTLKHMAREFDVVVTALSQLSRGVEQRQDKRPMMSDLRESGQIEQDADVIQFLYREDYYDKETEDQGMIEIIMAKHRDGPTGTVKLAFVKEYGKFVNLDYSMA